MIPTLQDEMRVEVAPDQEVTALIYPGGKPDLAGITLILGHGAGAGQRSGFMTSCAKGLAARGVTVVTFDFLYMEQGRRVPDPNNKLEACFRAVAEVVRHEKIGGTLVIGGKSMGGRIASQVASAGADVGGLVFLGYPLHPPGKFDQLRAKHLPDVKVPMLFIQGSRDAFGTPGELRPILKKVQVPTELYAVEGGDHSFKVSKRAGTTQEETDKAMLDRIEAWLRQTYPI